MDDNLRKICIWLGLGLVVTAGAAYLDWTRGYPVIHMLCDGFFVTAVLLLGMGGLKFFRNKGTFDMMSYSVSSVFQLHFPFVKMDSPLNARQEDFADYKERKKAKRKPASDLLWAGLIYLVLAVIMLVIYLLTG